jgi:hypothetical protein
MARLLYHIYCCVATTVWGVISVRMTAHAVWLFGISNCTYCFDQSRGRCHVGKRNSMVMMVDGRDRCRAKQSERSDIARILSILSYIFYRRLPKRIRERTSYIRISYHWYTSIFTHNNRALTIIYHIFSSYVRQQHLHYDASCSKP